MLSLIFLSQVTLYLFLFFYRPTLLFRPTFWVAGLILISISAAAAFYHNPTIDYQYHNEDVVRVIALIYPLCLMIWVVLVPLSPSTNLAGSNVSYSQDDSYSTLIIAVSFILIAVALVSLFRLVPYYKTGLYANFFDPDNALIFREYTFKLLPSSFVKRMLAHAKAVFIPFAFGFAYLKFRKSRNQLTNITLILVMVVSLIAVGISGARGPIGYLLLLMGILYMLEVGVTRGVMALLLLVLVALTLAFIFTGLRRGELYTADFERLLTFASRIVKRAFFSPFESGLLHNEYSAMNGPWGPVVIGFPLKGHLGIEHVNYYRIVGNWYSNTILGIDVQTTNLNTSYIFSQQAIWGLGIGTAISFLLIVLSDFAILIIYKFPMDIGKFAHAYILWKLIDVVSTDIVEVYWSITEALLALLGFIIVRNSLMALKNSPTPSKYVAAE